MAEPQDLGESSSGKCKICTRNIGKYVCPRCNVLYCSLPCYQSETHASCSEAFYRDCVMEEMKSQEPDSDAEKKMQEILKRLQQNENMDSNDDNLDSDDDDSIPDLHERLRNVNLDDADSVWEKLTLEERKEFEELLQSGDASELVAPWEPWWLYRKRKIMIQDVDAKDEIFNYKEKCPLPKKDIPSFSQISKNAPSPSVKYNILNVLAAYCYTTRFFNGEHHSNPPEASSTLVNLSGNLSLNHIYDSTIIAVEAVAHETVNCADFGGSPESLTCMKNDIGCILAGPEEADSKFYLQSALSDIHKLLSEAKNSKQQPGAGVKSSGEFTKRYSEASPVLLVPKEKLKMCLKKVEYYLSWSQDYFKDVCSQNLQL